MDGVPLEMSAEEDLDGVPIDHLPSSASSKRLVDYGGEREEEEEEDMDGVPCE